MDAADRSKIWSYQKRFFIALSLYPLSFFANTPFNVFDLTELEIHEYGSTAILIILVLKYNQGVRNIRIMETTRPVLSYDYTCIIKKIACLTSIFASQKNVFVCVFQPNFSMFNVYNNLFWIHVRLYAVFVHQTNISYSNEVLQSMYIIIW